MPAAYIELGAEDGGSLFVAELSDFQQVAGFSVLEWVEQPLVQN
jgi:hypothetical protein